MVQQETPVQLTQQELEEVVEQQLQEQQENQVVVDVVVLVQQQVLMRVQWQEQVVAVVESLDRPLKEQVELVAVELVVKEVLP